jgi:hypothetical protein
LSFVPFAPCSVALRSVVGRRVELAKEVEQNISNRAHGFPPVTKRGSFVRSNFFSSSSLLRIVPSSYWKARSLFRKNPTFLRQSGVLGGFFTYDAWRCMEKNSMMEDFILILDDGPATEKRTAVCGCFCGSLDGCDALFMTLGFFVFRFF